MTGAAPQSNKEFPWRVLSLRLTTFLSEGPSFDPTQMWTDVAKDTPDEEQNRPRSGEFSRVGQVEGMRLRLLGQPGRVDWLGEINIEQEIGSGELSAVSWALAHTLIARVAGVYLAVPEILVNRLAFGAILVQPVDDVRSGYVELNKLLGTVTIDPDHSTDFSYQINRRRISAVMPELVINRLSKWSVMSQNTIRLNIAAERDLTIIPSLHAVRLELDVNTVSDLRQELPSAQLRPIFDELIAMGVEIAEKGDVP